MKFIKIISLFIGVIMVFISLTGFVVNGGCRNCPDPVPTNTATSTITITPTKTLTPTDFVVIIITDVELPTITPTFTEMPTVTSTVTPQLVTNTVEPTETFYVTETATEALQSTQTATEFLQVTQTAQVTENIKTLVPTLQAPSEDVSMVLPVTGILIENNFVNSGVLFMGVMLMLFGITSPKNKYG